MRAICINLINLTTMMAIVASGGNDDDNEDEYEDGNGMSALCKVVAKWKREIYFLIFFKFPLGTTELRISWTYWFYFFHSLPSIHITQPVLLILDVILAEELHGRKIIWQFGSSLAWVKSLTFKTLQTVSSNNGQLLRGLINGSISFLEWLGRPFQMYMINRTSDALGETKTRSS